MTWPTGARANAFDDPPTLAELEREEYDARFAEAEDERELGPYVYRPGDPF